MIAIRNMSAQRGNKCNQLLILIFNDIEEIIRSVFIFLSRKEYGEE